MVILALLLILLYPLPWHVGNYIIYGERKGILVPTVFVSAFTLPFYSFIIIHG